MRKQAFFIVCFILIGVVVGVWRDKHVSGPIEAPQLSLKAGTQLPMAPPMPAFELTDMHGKPFTEQGFTKRWSFVFFGYTQCPKLCPMTLGSLTQLAQRIPKGQAQYVFISIDPEHDTPDVLKNYLSNPLYVKGECLGLTGAKNVVDALTKHVGIHVAQNHALTDVKERITHGGAIFLINPEGRLAAVFTTTNQPGLMANDFKHMQHAYANS